MHPIINVLNFYYSGNIIGTIKYTARVFQNSKIFYPFCLMGYKSVFSYRYRF